MVRTDTTNGAIICKMIANQLGMTFFGLLVTMAAVQSDKGAIILGAGVFSVLFYMYLLFYLTREQGRTDKIRIDGGRATPNPLRCTWLAIAANSVNILLAVLAIVSKLIVSIVSNISFAGAPAEGVEASPAVAASIFKVCDMIYKIIHSMYNGIIVSMGQSDNPIWLLVFILPSILVCTLGYLIGLKKG